MQSSKLSPVWQWPIQVLSSVLGKSQNLIRAWLLWVVTAGPIPSHIAFIMDGNRRFADRLHVGHHIGHSHGYDALLRTLKDCFDLHVKTVTLYAFSIDNFQRSSDEVSALMFLMQSKLEALIEKEGLASAYGIRVKVLGDLSLLPDGARTAAEKAMAVTSKNSTHVLNLCISYSSTHEIAQSVQQTCGSALKAVGNEEHGCDAEHGSADSVVMGGCKVQDVSAISSSHMSKCRYAQDYNCRGANGLSELSNNDAPNGMQDCLLKQYLEEEGDNSAGNCGLVHGGNAYHSVVGKNHGACTYENGEENAGNVMASDKSSAGLMGMMHRTSEWEWVLEGAFSQDSNSVAMEDSDSSECHTLSKNGYSACRNRDITNDGYSMGCDFVECCDNKPNDCQPSLKSSSSSISSMNRPLYMKDSFVADNTVRNTNKARNKDFSAKYTCGEHCRTDDRVLKLVKESVSEEEIEKHLYTGPSCPPPDLLIRTSGETHLSNFLLWQASFSHLAFCKVLWPEFSFWHLLLIILEYQRSLPILLKKQQQNHGIASYRNQHSLFEHYNHSSKSD